MITQEHGCRREAGEAKALKRAGGELALWGALLGAQASGFWTGLFDTGFAATRGLRCWGRPFTPGRFCWPDALSSETRGSLDICHGLVHFPPGLAPGRAGAEANGGAASLLQVGGRGEPAATRSYSVDDGKPRRSRKDFFPGERQQRVIFYFYCYHYYYATNYHPGS